MNPAHAIQLCRNRSGFFRLVCKLERLWSFSSSGGNDFKHLGAELEEVGFFIYVRKFDTF